MTEVASLHVGIYGDAQSALSALKQVEGQMNRTGGQTANSAKQAGTSIQGMMKAAKGFAAAWGLTKMAKMAYDCTMVAARAQELGVVLDTLGKNAGYGQAALDNYEESVKSLGITTNASREMLVRMVQANMELSNATKIARLAQDAAVVGMQNSSEAANELLYAITSLQPRILRKYGIIVNLNDAYKQYAGSVHKTVDALSGEERQTAMLNAVLDQGKNIAGAYEAAMGTAGKQQRSLARHVEEAARAVGEQFIPALEATLGPLADMFDWIAKNAGAIYDWVSLQAPARAVAAFLNGVTIEQQKLYEASYKVSQEMLEKYPRMAGVYELMEHEAKKLGLTERQLLDQQYALAASMAQVEAEGGDVNAELNEMRGTADAAAQKYWELIKAFAGVQERERVTAVDIANEAAAHWQAALAATGHKEALIQLQRAQQYGGVEMPEQEFPTYKGTAATAYAARRAYEAYQEMDYTARRTELLKELAGAEQAAAQAANARAEAYAQIAERQAAWEQERVDNARRAELQIRYWAQDRYEWIADNEANLSDELKAEYARRTEEAKAWADRVKEYDAELAKDILDAEADYQRERARIEKMEDEEQKAAALAILEREHQERLERTQEEADLEREIRDRERQRELAEMRENAEAMGRAFTEPIIRALGDLEKEHEKKAQRYAALAGEPFIQMQLKASETAAVIPELWGIDPFGTVKTSAHDAAQEVWDIRDAAVAAKDAIQNIPGVGKGGGSTSWGSGGGSTSWEPPGREEGGDIPETGIYLLHKHEEVIPANRRRAQGAGGVTVQIMGPVYASSAEAAAGVGRDAARGLDMALRARGFTL
jgi:hypothetical protein